MERIWRNRIRTDGAHGDTRTTNCCWRTDLGTHGMGSVARLHSETGFAMTDIPKPPIDLDRMRRASQQPTIDVAWMRAAMDYIDQLLEHIERTNNANR